MQRYRRLTIEELEAVRPEFVKFLASKHVADDWERKLREGSPDVEASSMNSVRSSGTVLRLPSRASNTGLIRQPVGVPFRGIRRTRDPMLEAKRARSMVARRKELRRRGPRSGGFLATEQGAQPCSEDRFKEVHDQMTAAANQA